MTPTRTAMAETVIEKVAWWYARRVWWMDVAELIQQGWLAALECGHEKCETDEHFRAYVYRTVSNHLSRFCWKWSSPMSDSRAGKHLKGVRRMNFADVEERQSRNMPVRASAKTHLLPDEAMSDDPEMEMLKAEARMLVPHFREQLKRRIYQLAGEGGPAIRGVVLVLVDGVKPSTAARLAGVNIKSLYRATEWVKAEAIEDDVVRLLLANIEDRRKDL